MDQVRVGTMLRSIRLRQRWRQEDVARRAHVSRATVSRIEAGHMGTVTVDTVERVAAALGANVEASIRWRGGDLARLIDAGHAAMHESLAGTFRDLPGWVAVPEASFSIFGERGIVDILAWHEGRRIVLVVELKTQLVDLSGLLGTLDRKRRLAPALALERGWHPVSTAVWLVVADTPVARATLASHSTVLRQAFPADGRRMRAWLRAPTGSVAALTFLDNARLRNLRPGSRRVSRSAEVSRVGLSHAVERGRAVAGGGRRHPGPEDTGQRSPSVR